ncbi:aldehyde dehydrogenase family protein [Alteribacillus sp. YIM 98480]|uniref:aldehyde dehydrogenase family protein n=1 Tax=Alteribacillus sp. YIM 98480 TaxID=2606599 RepID=UPI00131AF38D|nr:aldehyde dehydrogenase family protein [Alteribacillus sp. YIM 98480]
MATMTALNSKVAEFTSTPKQMFIDGKFVDALSGKRFATYNPATGESITTVPEAGKEDVDLAVQVARKAFDGGPWPKTKPAERSRLLHKLADLIEENIEELTQMETLDNGVPLEGAKNFVMASVGHLRYYAGWPSIIKGDTVPNNIPGELFNYTRREPIGVCGQIIPWNSPIINAVMKIAAPVACGNTVVLKTAEQTPLSGVRLAELIQEAGFPDGVVNIISGFGSTAGAALTEHLGVDKIAFTGSTEVGKEVMRSSAVNVKKVSLELGGKSANIIFADADYDQAIANAANAIFWNSGQVCCAGSRLFVERKIYDRFVSDLVEYSKNFRVGNGFNPESVLGPLVSKEQLERVNRYRDLAKQEGSEVLEGGSGDEKEISSGYFVKPTVLANVTNDMCVAQEEIFGPVVGALPFETIDEVVELANQTQYGLGGGVCTTDVRKAHRVAHAMRTGNVWVNTYNVIDATSPFGGYKQSGIGRENGSAAIDMYTEIKNVWVNLD